VLQAAVNHCHAQGYLLTPIKVTLPPMPAPRDHWLTRDEAARLLRAAYRNPKARHLARFILVALYTGTRSNPIRRMQYMPNTSGGWVDTKRGVMYRRAAGESESKKRTPPVPIPRPLLAHLHRWKRQGARYVVEVGGQRVGCLKTAWRTALEEAGIDYCLLGIDVLVPAHRRPLRQPARRPRLGDEHLAPGGVDPYPEPRQLAVPENSGSAFHGQAVDGSLVQLDGAHEPQPFPCPGTWRRGLVPRRPGGLPAFREAVGFSVRKSVFKSQPTDVQSLSPQAIA